MLLTLTALLLAFMANAQITGSTCINRYATSQSYGYVISPIPSSPTWSVLGDIAIVSSTSTNVVIRSTGPAKGRIVLTYNQGSCTGQQLTKDVYKTFTWANNIIVGPICIKQGDTVTYSVPDSLSRNLTAGIGIDNYHYTLPSSWQHLYSSGDSSSITAVVTTLGANDTIKVKVGQCNSKIYKLAIAQATPAPVLISPPSCVSSSTTSLTMSVTAVAGITYTWSIPSNWSFNSPLSGIGSTVTLNVDGNPGTVTITATSANSCNPAITSYNVTRAISDGASVVGPTCVNKNAQYSYGLTSAPINTEFVWSLPPGWTLISPNGGSSIVAEPGSGAVNGYIKVKSKTCSGADSIAVKINSGQGLAFGIADLGECLYRASATGFNRTGATFAWTLDGAPIGTFSGTNTIQLGCGSTGNLCVRITRTSDCLDTLFCTPISSCSCDGLFRMAAPGETSSITDIKDAKVFPNPAKTSDKVTLLLPSSGEEVTITIADYTGKIYIHLNTTKSKEIIDVSQLGRGNYIVNFQTKEKGVAKKLFLE